MGERQLGHLRARRLDELSVGKAERSAPQASHPFDIALALAVIDAHAFAALDNERPAVTEARQLRIRMDESLDVAGLEVGKRHDLTLVGIWTANFMGQCRRARGADRMRVPQHGRKCPETSAPPRPIMGKAPLLPVPKQAQVSAGGARGRRTARSALPRAGGLVCASSPRPMPLSCRVSGRKTGLHFCLARCRDGAQPKTHHWRRA